METRNAFTMIELVFIIVIIGILAVTALPRLAATRDDAKRSTIAHNTMVAAEDIAAYAIARGKTASDLSEMSYAVEEMVNSGDASKSGTTLNVHWGGVSNCIVLKINNQGAHTETLVINADDSGSGSECDKLRSLIDSSSFPMPLHGTLISI